MVPTTKIARRCAVGLRVRHELLKIFVAPICQSEATYQWWQETMWRLMPLPEARKRSSKISAIRQHQSSNHADRRKSNYGFIYHLWNGSNRRACPRIISWVRSISRLAPNAWL